MKKKLVSVLLVAAMAASMLLAVAAKLILEVVLPEQAHQQTHRMVEHSLCRSTQTLLHR